MISVKIEPMPAYNPHADPIKAAEALNQVVVTPKPNELFLDIDTDEQFNRFKDIIHLIMQFGVKVSYTVTPSKTQGHRHVTVEFDVDLDSDMERVALQAILGSDPRREAYSWYRARIKAHLPVVFFENRA